MPRFNLHPSSGTGFNTPFAKAIRFARYGCTNRPFYHIVLMNVKTDPRKAPIEQLGTYDPIPNVHNEKLVAFNYERIQFWLFKGARMSKSVAELLGLAGFLPVYPKTYSKAWTNRRIAKENRDKENIPEEKQEAAN